MIDAALTALVTILVIVAYGTAGVAAAIGYRAVADWLGQRRGSRAIRVALRDVDERRAARDMPARVRRSV